MNEEDYLEELQDRLLSCLNTMDMIKPERYKDLKRFEMKLEINKTMLRVIQDEIKRIEGKIREVRNNDKPRIH